MQSDELVKKVFDRSMVKWLVAALLGMFLILSTFLLIGLKSQYATVDFCVLSVNCSQVPEQVTDRGQMIRIIEEPIEDVSTTGKGLKIAVKPLGAAVTAGVASGAAIAALVGLGIISLPIELAIAIGALIGSGTYAALKILY